MNGLLRKDFLFIAKKYKVSLLFLLIDTGAYNLLL